MTDPNIRVCARCGRPAADTDFCVCGANLSAMRAMLPTRAQWEAANPEKAAVPPPEPPPPAPATPARTRPIKWEGMPPSFRDRLRKQILPSAAVIAVFAVIVIVGSGSKSHTSRRPSGSASTPTTSTTHTSTTSTVQRTPDPTVQSCATAWNGGRSATHRHILDLRIPRDQPPKAVVATYAGPDQRLARAGGGSLVLLSARACIIIARTSVFIQQPNRNWGLVMARRGYPFTTIASGGNWVPTHANATVIVGPLPGGPPNVGALTPSGRTLEVLTAADVGRPPTRQP